MSIFRLSAPIPWSSLLRFIALAVMPAVAGPAATCSTVEYSSMEPVSETVTGTYTHTGSGMQFPERLGEFSRVEVTRFDQAGDDVSVGYDLNTPENLIIATVFVYPRSHDLGEEFDSARQEVEGVHEGAEVVSGREAALIANPEKREGLKGTFRYRQSFGGFQVPVQSDLLVFVFDDWVIKYRFTYPQETVALSAEQIQQFIQDLRWTA